MSPQKDVPYMPIGLDRPVRLQWLERTAFLALAGNNPAAIKSILQEDLKTSFRSSNTQVRGSISKTITVLHRTWANPPSNLEPLRLEGLELLRAMTPSNRIVVHWGMLMAVYPFWSSVATQVGRLLRLQGTAAAVHIQRRLREQYGQRETVSRRVRYVMRSYVEWGVLHSSGRSGVYSAAPILTVDDPSLTAWLVEAFLHTRLNGSAPLKTLMESPGLFPFQLMTSPRGLAKSSSRLDLLHHGLDEYLVLLRK